MSASPFWAFGLNWILCTIFLLCTSTANFEGFLLAKIHENEEVASLNKNKKIIARQKKIFLWMLRSTRFRSWDLFDLIGPAETFSAFFLRVVAPDNWSHSRYESGWRGRMIVRSQFHNTEVSFFRQRSRTEPQLLLVYYSILQMQWKRTYKVLEQNVPF